MFPFVLSCVYVYLWLHIRLVFQALLSLYVLLSVRECSTQHAHQEKRLVTWLNLLHNHRLLFSGFFLPVLSVKSVFKLTEYLSYFTFISLIKTRKYVTAKNRMKFHYLNWMRLMVILFIIDVLQHWQDSEFVAVYHKGRFFRLWVYRAGRLLSPREIEYQIQKILDDPSPPQLGEEKLGALTAGDRYPPFSTLIIDSIRVCMQ